MTAQELLARVRRRIADFDQATMQLEHMTYSKVDADLDSKIARYLEDMIDPLDAKSGKSPPKPVPKWTAWPAVGDEGVPMARVRIDVGQFSFQAGSQYDPAKPDDFAQRVHNVMNAITIHARVKGWL